MFDYKSIDAKSFITYWPYILVFIVIFQILRLYPGVSLAPSEEMRRITIGSVMAYVGIIFSRYLEHNIWDSINTAFVISCVFSTLIILVARSVCHLFLYKTKLGGIPAVVFGSGKTAKLVCQCLKKNTSAGYTPVLFLDDNPDSDNEIDGIPVIHDTRIAHEIVKRYNIKMAIVAMPALESKKLKKLINTSVSAFRYNIIIPNFYTFSSIWMSVRDFNGVLGIDASSKFKLTWNLFLKRLLDLGIVIIGGLMVLPFLLIIAFLIKISSKGPVFFKQKRVGKNGKHFIVYKFRSMILDAENKLQEILNKDPALMTEYKKNHKLKKDPRITLIGKFIRRTSIDEIPQIINVLKGEMSLVGPRPIFDFEVPEYEDDFERVFSIKPGITGMWQVSGRSDAYESRVTYDTYYQQSWSLWLDLWIIYKTFGVVIFGKGAY
jgi:Undecaprenyl-phosphate galactose phosphotransferase WbaP